MNGESNQTRTQNRPAPRRTGTRFAIVATCAGAGAGDKTMAKQNEVTDLLANLADELRSTQNQARREHGEKYAISDYLAREVMRIAAGTPARSAKAGLPEMRETVRQMMDDFDRAKAGA